MGRSSRERVDRSRRRRRRTDGLWLLFGAVVLAFVVIGMISSGLFLSRLSSAGPAPTATPNVAPILVRAHAEATAIVLSARTSAERTAARIQHEAQARATQIASRARTTVHHTTHGHPPHHARKPRQSHVVQRSKPAHVAPTAAPPYVAPTAVPVYVAPVRAVPSPTPAPVYVAPTAAPVQPVQPYVAPTPTLPAAAAPGPLYFGTGNAPPPSQSSLPPTWLVVAYNADPHALTVDVANRANIRFSGTVTVTYLDRSGRAVGSSSASFAGLAPHSTAVLPLVGSPYPATAVTWRVQVSNVH